jgi:hypothetical protein
LGGVEVVGLVVNEALDESSCLVTTIGLISTPLRGLRGSIFFALRSFLLAVVFLTAMVFLLPKLNL